MYNKGGQIMKMFNFSVNEISGRTFELPYDKAIEVIKSNCPDKYIDFGKISQYELAELLWDYCYDDIEEYELGNNTFQSDIDETKIYNVKE